MTSADTHTQFPLGAPTSVLSDKKRLQAFAFGGMIDIPVTFFLNNRMHLRSNELAVFKLWIGLPLIVGFVFGFIRGGAVAPRGR